MEILEKTFKQMPSIFTSNAFNQQAVKNGYPKRLLKNNGLAWFLHKHADNDKVRTKTWIKRTNKVNNDNREESYYFSNLQEIIDFVKSKGYKVMKPVSEWIEV